MMIRSTRSVAAAIAFAAICLLPAVAGDANWSQAGHSLPLKLNRAGSE